MTTPQTFYAVLDSEGLPALLDEANANKAEAVARKEAAYWEEPHRVIAYTVVATFGGTDE